MVLDEFWNSSTMPMCPAAPPPGGLVQVTLIWALVHAAGPAGAVDDEAADELGDVGGAELDDAADDDAVELEVAGELDAVPSPLVDDVQAANDAATSTRRRSGSAGPPYPVDA